MRLPQAFQDAIRALALLPGVGERSAQRHVFHLLDHPDKGAAISEALSLLAARVGHCTRCFHLAETDAPEGLCTICLNAARRNGTLCVVETVPHLLAVERSGSFRGGYHVLHGALSPIKGLGPAELGIPHLVARVQSEDVEEVIVATDVDVEGEATAAYLVEVLAPMSVRVTRIATGVPMGSDLEFIDGTTLARALAARS